MRRDYAPESYTSSMSTVFHGNRRCWNVPLARLVRSDDLLC